MSSLSEISGFTGTAPAGPIKEEDEVDYSSARQFLQSFRQKARYWRDNQDRGNDRKLRVEREVPFSARLERQPYYALLDLLSNHTRPSMSPHHFKQTSTAYRYGHRKVATRSCLHKLFTFPSKGNAYCWFSLGCCSY